tara:strand:+ start:13955 stop:14119 length:165 start_codon:yes stop_codon:yes gene_type:complete
VILSIGLKLEVAQVVFGLDIIQIAQKKMTGVGYFQHLDLSIGIRKIDMDQIKWE